MGENIWYNPREFKISIGSDSCGWCSDGYTFNTISTSGTALKTANDYKTFVVQEPDKNIHIDDAPINVRCAKRKIKLMYNNV